MIPTRFTLLVLLTALSAPVAAQTDEAARLFDEGNTHFRDGQFEEARTAYEAALSKGFESGALYYNLGGTYFRLDRLGKAMVNYRRAARLLGDDPALVHNIDLVKGRARDQLSVLPKPVWSKWWNGLVDAIGLMTLFWSGVAAWVAGLALVGHGILTGAATPAARRLASTLVAFGLLAGVGAVAASEARSNNVSAVIVTREAHLLEEPANSSRIALVIHEGLTVDVLGSDERWLEIRLPNGVTGFVEPEEIEVI